MRLGTALHKPYDIISKQIIDRDPMAWVRFLRLPGEEAELLDTDLSTAVQPDRLIHVTGGIDYVLHLEPQASYKAGKVLDAKTCNAVAERKYGLPVRTVFLLLREDADGPEMSGLHNSGGSLTLQFDVVRMWQLAPAEFLQGPTQMAPLAVISKASLTKLPEIIATVAKLIEAEPENEQSALWLELTVLLGLNLKEDVVRHLLPGVKNMKESTTYQAILEEGRQEGRQEGLREGMLDGERRILMSVGTLRLGAPSPAVQTIVSGLKTAEEIETLVAKVLSVENWEELLGFTENLPH